MNRQKFLTIYLPILFLLGLLIFFSLKIYSQTNFSKQSFDKLVYTTNSNKDKTDDLCKYQLLGEPEVGNKYIKINFWCQNGNNSRSTLSLEAIENNSTINGILKEYARIINFDYSLIQNNRWYCLFNDQEITDFNQPIKAAGTIDCFENKSLYRHDQKDL